jgi:Protein of unknown function (DUF3099)
MVHKTHRRDVTLVTDAQRPMSEDIAFRERRYLLMMAIRVVCFIVAVVLFVAHQHWLAAIPAIGAIVIPYFAVVFANGGREPSNTRGLRIYQPNLPDRYLAAQDPAPEPSRSATADPPPASASDEGAEPNPGGPEDYGTH